MGLDLSIHSVKSKLPDDVVSEMGRNIPYNLDCASPFVVTSFNDNEVLYRRKHYDFLEWLNMEFGYISDLSPRYIGKPKYVKLRIRKGIRKINRKLYKDNVWLSHPHNHGKRLIDTLHELYGALGRLDENDLVYVHWVS